MPGAAGSATADTDAVGATRSFSMPELGAGLGSLCGGVAGSWGWGFGERLIRIQDLCLNESSIIYLGCFAELGEGTSICAVAFQE